MLPFAMLVFFVVPSGSTVSLISLRMLQRFSEITKVILFSVVLFFAFAQCI